MSKEEVNPHKDDSKQRAPISREKWIELGLATAIVVFTAFMFVLNYLQYGAYREFSQTELRAYVYPADILSDEDAARGFPFGKVTFYFKNFGATPAINLRGWAGLAYVDDDRNFEVNLDTMDVTDDPPIMVPSQSGTEAFVKLPLGAYDPEHPVVKRLFLYGKYQYEDAFGGVHTEKFCYHYIHEHKKFVPHTLRAKG